MKLSSSLQHSERARTTRLTNMALLPPYWKFWERRVAGSNQFYIISGEIGGQRTWWRGVQGDAGRRLLEAEEIELAVADGVG